MFDIIDIPGEIDKLFDMEMPVSLMVTILGFIALIAIILLISTAAISKTRAHTIRQMKKQYGTLEDELKRQREDNLLMRNESKRINKLDLLFSSSMIRLTEILDPIEIAKTARDFLREYLDAREVAVFFWDAQTKRLNVVTQYGLNENWIPKLLYNLGDGRVGVTAEKRLPVGKREADMLRVEEPYPIFEPDICYPVVFHDNLYGVIAIGRDADFKEREKNLLGVVSKIAAVSLKNTWDLKLFQNLASIDPLTKIFNVGYFKDRLQETLIEAKKLQRDVSIAIIDLDKFKNYNDTFGHQAGDKLLIDLAKIFAKYFYKPSIFARYGGDEFIVMCPNSKKKNVADILTILLRELDKADFTRMKEGERVTFSAGISSYPDDGNSMVELIKAADEALYIAKGARENKIQLYVRDIGKK
jgi:two-component system cell cycle response regulator